MDTNTFLPSKCTHMVKVITAVDYKSSNTHNTSLEGAMKRKLHHSPLKMVFCTISSLQSSERALFCLKTTEYLSSLLSSS